MVPSEYSEDVNSKLTMLPKDMVDFCEREKMQNYNISALAGMLFYISYLEEVENVLEIGSGWCLSTISFAAAVRPRNGRVLSFDIHDRSNILSTVPELNPFITQINANSRNTNVTYPLIDKHFEEVDLLFIDGDHTKEGAQADLDNYSPLVKDNGIILFHDIALYDPGKGQDSIEVCKVWDEVDTSKYNKFPMYASNGLGMLRKKPTNE